MKKIHLISLGCPKNRVDSEAIIGQLTMNGYQLTDQPADADVVIVNTCGFLQESVNEALSEIATVALLKEKRSFQLVVTGCLVQRMGGQLRREVPEIDALVGVHSYGKILEALERGGQAIKRTATAYGRGFYSRRQLTTGPGWAYLRIADGCDNRCSYCTIPSIRGPFRSRTIADIVAEAQVLAHNGVRELDLIAQDTTNFGVDRDGKRELARLLRRLAGVDGIQWLRLLYTHPAHFDDGIVAAVAELPQVVKYLDVPLQHISDRILKAMHRGIDGRKTRELVHRLKHEVPGVVLRTTFIVGLPGETDDEYGELLDFAREAHFERMGAFAYSPEPGTRAAAMRGQVPDRVKQERLHQLMSLQRKISARYGRERVGRTCEVLVEGASGADAGIPRRTGHPYCGRSAAEAPEVDGKVYVRSPKKLTAGRFVKIKIDKYWDYDVGGEII